MRGKIINKMMRSRVNASLTSAILISIGLFLTLFIQGNARAAINDQINFQGKIINNTGSTNIADGTYNMEFKIYSGGDGVVGGGDETLLWTESRLKNNSQGVLITNGIFQVNLGSVNATLASSVDFNNSTLWLTTNLGNTNASCTPFTSCVPDGEMSPMVRFTAAPYAFNSDKLDGLDSTAFGQLVNNQTWTGTNTLQPTTNITGAIIKQTSVGSPTADILNVQTANGTNVIQVTGPAANESAVTIQSIGATRQLTLQSGSGTVSFGSSTTITATGALTVASGGSSGLALNSASGRVTISSGDFVNTSVAGVAGAASGDIWYDSTAQKYKINENGTTKILCNGTDLACESPVSLQTAYNYDGSGEADIVTTAIAKSILFKAGSTFDSANLFHVQNAAGANLLTVNSSSPAIQVGSSTTDATAVVLVLDSYNQATDPTGIVGGMYYNTNKGNYRCYEAGIWKSCITHATSLGTRSFIDTTADAAADNNTTTYWDSAAENGTTFPNITLSSTNKSVLGIVTVETQSTGTGDVEVTARVERSTGASVASCNTGTAVGGQPGTFASNTNARKTSTSQFVDSPASVSKLWYNVCADTDTVGTTANITRIRVTLIEIENSNL